MSKKIKGHVAHKMIVKGRTYFYIVAPERESVEAYAEWDQYPIGYVLVESIHITPRMVGRHGYLQSVIKRLAEYLSGDYTVVYCHDDENEPPWSTKYDVLFGSKEEKKMHKKTKVNGHVLHKLPECDNLYYTVEPEHGCIAVYRLKPDEINGGLCYAEFEDIAIHTALLGRPGYLQEQIELISKKHFKEEKKMDTTNIRHFVLVTKIKSDNDRVMHDCEYIQVVQQGGKFMLLFDSADITQTEAADLTKYLSGVLSIKDVDLSTNPEFMNYVISFTDNSGLGVDPLQHLCSILADGAKYKHAYPLRARYKAVSSVSSISFFIQENADTPIYKKEWPSLLNGTLHFWPYVIQRSESRPYIHNLVDRDPSQTLSVIDGRVRGLPFHKYPLIYGDIFHKEYSDKDELISDFRGLIDDRKIFANASKVYIEFQPDREKI